MDFHYNSVLENGVTRAFTVLSGEIDVQGSYVWMPGHELWWKNDLSALTTNGCFLSQPNSQISSDFWTGDPQIGSDYAPRGSSPVLDYCDSNYFTPTSDAFHQYVEDVPGVENRFSMFMPDAWDLGAVEQSDIIYANTFDYRPWD